MGSPRCIGVDPATIVPHLDSTGYIAQLANPLQVTDPPPAKECDPPRLRKTSLDEIRGDTSAATQRQRGLMQSAVYPGPQAVPIPPKGAARRPRTAHPRMGPEFKRELWPGTPVADAPIGDSVAAADCARFAPVRLGMSMVRLQNLCAREVSENRDAQVGRLRRSRSDTVVDHSVSHAS